MWSDAKPLTRVNLEFLHHVVTPLDLAHTRVGADDLAGGCDVIELPPTTAGVDTPGRPRDQRSGRSCAICQRNWPSVSRNAISTALGPSAMGLRGLASWVATKTLPWATTGLPNVRLPSSA